MQIIIRNLAVALIAILSLTTTYAAVNPTISLDNGKTLVVNLNDWTNTDVEITIEDFEGQILHLDKFRSGSTVGKKYNMKNLPNGSYNLIIESSAKKAVHMLKVEKNSISVETFSYAKAHIPYVNITENAIELNQLTLGNNLSVSISDRKGAFFGQTYSNMTTVNKRFDINNLPSGDYLFTLACDNKNYSFPFVKK